MSVFRDIPDGDWIASNDLAFAISDAFPVGPGHTLIIPRRVVSTWWDATAAERIAILDLIDRIKLRLDAELQPDGFNVGFNAGAAAGQTVEHLHLHVIPRFAGDVEDPRGGVRHVIPGRGNYLAAPTSAPMRPPTLVTPHGGQLTLELFRAMSRPDLDRIDLVVSFVQRSGIDLIAHHVDDALARGARIRLLTTDYLAITDAAALGFFLDRLTSGPVGRLDARVFSDASTSFHPKAYIFTSSATGDGVAFVGSSNLSRSGIATGVEWNLQTFGTAALVEQFDRLWDDGRSVDLTSTWLADYADRREELRRDPPDAPASPPAELEAGEEVEPAPRPWSVQAEAMTALEAARLEGHEAGLVVMATGLGKTWLAAFDSTRPEFRRVLFVAHREEILAQSRDVYRQIRPSDRLTLFIGDERDPGGHVVFASVQSLHRNLGAFAPDRFDYIVVDEFHHAAADTYRKVIAHFRPRFMLGLTATPDRSDNADLLALCADNLIFDCGLSEGIRRQLLSPFRYRAIPDVADYEHVPWRNGRFDLDELTAQVATRERARQVLDEWSASGAGDRRCLAFCCTITHADFMAEYFRENGVSAVAVHSGPSSSPRAESLQRLADGTLAVIFTVDLFNEGVDVPAIDLVLMLRPTESSIVFLQQLGRGLRRSDDKARLDVVDLVGNHRGFLLKARLLVQLAGFAGLTDREAVELLRARRDDLAEGEVLPDGCSIIVEPTVVDLLRDLLGTGSRHDRMVELVRSWTDEHGARPTALELSVVTGVAHQLKARGGWFGFLDRLGLLTDDESATLAQVGEFLLSIEHGNYTKSFKLVTLSAIADAGGLSAAPTVRDVANGARWIIQRDPDLQSDLSDAGSSFTDLRRPTQREWEVYWRRNPIAALTSPTRGDPAWFTVSDDDRLTSTLELPTLLWPTLDLMVRELVQYRLHRYVTTRTARRGVHTRRPMSDGAVVDGTFTIGLTGALPTSVVIESAGGTAGSPNARNTEYVRAFDLVLRRLEGLGATLVDAYIDTTRTSDLTLADRRLDPGEGMSYPIPLAAGVEVEELRRALLRSMSRTGRKPGTKGGGNARKRTRLVLEIPERWTAESLADALEHGHDRPTATPRSTGTQSGEGTG